MGKEQQAITMYDLYEYETLRVIRSNVEGNGLPERGDLIVLPSQDGSRLELYEVTAFIHLPSASQFASSFLFPQPIAKHIGTRLADWRDASNTEPTPKKRWTDYENSDF